MGAFKEIQISMEQAIENRAGRRPTPGEIALVYEGIDFKGGIPPQEKINEIAAAVVSASINPVRQDGRLSYTLAGVKFQFAETAAGLEMQISGNDPHADFLHYFFSYCKKISTYETNGRVQYASQKDFEEDLHLLLADEDFFVE